MAKDSGLGCGGSRWIRLNAVRATHHGNELNRVIGGLGKKAGVKHLTLNQRMIRTGGKEVPPFVSVWRLLDWRGCLSRKGLNDIYICAEDLTPGDRERGAPAGDGVRCKIRDSFLLELLIALFGVFDILIPNRSVEESQRKWWWISSGIELLKVGSNCFGCAIQAVSGGRVHWQDGCWQ